mmetsp:Transcript_120156/g.311873  ORF Transcript_120156/g.311873 Transcript_120156/m.311873 type:complete len:90 (+) Transcript_120156:1745-2014(+)
MVMQSWLAFCFSAVPARLSRNRNAKLLDMTLRSAAMLMYLTKKASLLSVTLQWQAIAMLLIYSCRQGPMWRSLIAMVILLFLELRVQAT